MKHRTSKISDRTVHPSEKATDLTGRQLSHLEQLATSKNCIPHPSFELSCTEEELFGSDAPEVRVNAWSNFPELPGDIPPRHQGHTPLRSEDEVRLFLRYNYARYRLASLARMPGKKSSPIRIAEMYGWYQRAMRLRCDLTGANLALVIAMAKRMNIPDVDFSELISEGNMALLRAIEKFDVSRGYKFSTYACRVILKSFSRLASKSSTHRRRFGAEFDPSMEPEGFIEQKRRTIQSDALARLHEILIKNHADLTATEQRVIDQRFALTKGGKKKTLALIGKEMSVSKERIRQIQRAAIAKLRRAFIGTRLSA